MRASKVSFDEKPFHMRIFTGVFIAKLLTSIQNQMIPDIHMSSLYIFDELVIIISLY
jgi:hypothetical protein